ncbi:MAG: RdgB/HAM1 family non-canonical purine NTP pyrophosphatase [Desulfovibrionaceae bacterium]|nr:RdgB/HAM1 family non-canonical purine NTP pyrophosphatase [Desulfovibrionaceae bacterium]
MTQLRRVVLATHNQGKVRELAEPLKALGVEVLGLGEFPEVGDIIEDGTTFADNACIKAAAVARITGLTSIADDSGLEVDALNGRPGVYSARYSDDMPLLEGETRDACNIRKLIAEMAGVPDSGRTARFVCTMAAVRPGLYAREQALIVSGAWEGRILAECRGTNGFGYDPVFLDEELGISAAEMTREQKMGRSHRGCAVRALVRAWPAWLAG